MTDLGSISSKFARAQYEKPFLANYILQIAHKFAIGLQFWLFNLVISELYKCWWNWMSFFSRMLCAGTFLLVAQSLVKSTPGKPWNVYFCLQKQTHHKLLMIRVLFSSEQKFEKTNAKSLAEKYFSIHNDIEEEM